MTQPLLRRYAGALIYDGERVLLGKRAAHRARYPGVWDIFGGHIEPGETSLAALKRELREELNMRVTAAQPVGLVSGHDAEDALGFEMTVFLVSRWEAPLWLHPKEHDEMRWFTPAELDVLLPIIDPRLPTTVRQMIEGHGMRTPRPLVAAS